MKRSTVRCVGATLAGCLGAIVAAFAVAQQAPAPSDPIELFTKLMPVFGHPRCTNCHGGMNPHQERGIGFPIEHPAGLVRWQNECQNCHNATQAIKDNWRIAAHESLRFFGKNAKQMCDMQSEKVRERTRAGYLRHLENDILVTQAFDGMAGGARDPDPPDKPTMSRGDFLRAAREWVNAGALCGGWEGEITQTEEFASNYGYTMPMAEGRIDVSVRESANREIRIHRNDGSNSGTVTTSGHQTMVQTMHLIGEHGPCTAVITSNSDWRSLPPAEPGVSVRISIQADGSYTIRFAGPEEKTVTNDSSHSVNDCGVALPPNTVDPPIELTWHPWVYLIRCPSNNGICRTFDPNRYPLIDGTTVENVLGASDAAERRSWLNVSPVGTSRSDDGAPLPVKVKTTWNLTLEE